MYKAVTVRDMPLPVLIDCLPGTGVPLELGGRGRAPDGFIFSGEDGGTLVRVLSWDFFRLLRGKRLQALYSAYGLKLGTKEYANLRSLILLSQQVQTGGFDIRRMADGKRISISIRPTMGLRKYVEMQAAIRAREKAPVPSVTAEEWSKEKVQAEEIWKQFQPSTGGHALFELARQMDRRARSGRLVLWWSQREEMLQAGIYFSRIQDAIYALFTLQTARPQGVGICERCGKVFKRSRVAQKVCSTKCGNYIRKQRERAKTKKGRRQ
jgi:hypothetical protein